MRFSEGCRAYSEMTAKSAIVAGGIIVAIAQSDVSDTDIFANT
ncbi:hypothetical protein X560_0359 [Listeria fleischmannii 1991]|uniref:Uncharacterized protein n=1 Tax=Listeria fleischmannii 1991 TaxID=1430899 RepID=A0A0J8GIY4_9LIST|nr:hypothetical protein X560_0359 [Listeria fleischmannii 1991]